MAKLKNISLILIISYFFVTTAADVYARNIVGGKEMMVKLNFYVRDLRMGNPSPTVYEVAAASITGNFPTKFGSVHIVDDLLTAEPDYNSLAVGRVQELTTSADLSANAVAINLNFYFTVGRFNGSTISVLGRNPVAEAQREPPVVGGTGAFQYARGYALTSNTYNDAKTNYSVLQHTIYTTYNSKLTESDDDVEIAEM